ncbi:MAG: Anaerobic sulfite reductase subunit C [Candidatus Heimdallarchaeota archaeon LC_3]|nr:MAG: Anaerobic sulfite reductase subunit C [Candidatus Heimdallarchaeota archaeon LC_3]
MGNSLEQDSIKWSPEAKQRLEKAPFFIRKIIKKKALNHAKKNNLSLITDEVITLLKEKTKNSSTVKEKINEKSIKKSSGLKTAGGILSETDYQLIKSLMNSGIYLNDPDQDESYEIKLCGGAKGCPLSLVDIESLGKKIDLKIEELGWSEFFHNNQSEPILFHSKLKIAIAGCPNACSEPQIKDISIITQEKPKLLEENCNQCSICYHTCKESAIKMNSMSFPEFNQSCINCGQCIMVCPFNALGVSKKGFQLSMGGKLGRNPQLALKIKDFASEEEILSKIEQAIILIKENTIKGSIPRLGNLIINKNRKLTENGIALIEN